MDEREELFLSETAYIRQEKDYLFRLHSSIGVGGKTRRAFFPKKISELVFLVERARRYDVALRVLGKVTNCLPCDEESERMAVFTTDINSVGVGKEEVFALCGATIKRFLDVCEREGKTGGEFLEGIPATIGGALFMNAGVGGKHISDIVESVLVYKDGKIRTMTKDDCGFAYRRSVFMQEDSVILGGLFFLRNCKSDCVRERREGYRTQRSRLPVGKSMGCVFKNPKGESAGKLIEGAGLKGLRKGGAVVSDKHANFILNDNLATAADIKELIAIVKNAVAAQYGVRLEEEIRYLD